MDEINVGIVLFAGMITFFSPCILPVIPVFVSTLLTGVEKKSQKALAIGSVRIYLKPILRVTLFVLGLSTSFVILGFAFGAISQFIARNNDLLLIICGAVVIVFGIYQTGIVKIPLLMNEKKLEAKKQRKGLIGAYILGFTFSFGWTPCVGPILMTVLAMVATQGSALAGGLYMVVYSLGLLIPFLVITLFSNMLIDRIHVLYKHMNKIKIVGGIILALAGAYLVLDGAGLY